jgi:cell wall-associated NlpC family hydrolase
VTTGIAAVQARIVELSELVSELPAAVTALTGASGATGSTAASSSASDIASAASFASTLAALGIDPSTVTALTGTAGATDPTGSTAAGTQTGQGLVAAAEKYIGVPYVWGGDTSSGLDCSGLVQRAMTDLGVTGIPRVASDQMRLGTAVPSLDQALPGDLLVFGGGTHIGIYVGDGQMIDAPKPGKTVAVRAVFETPSAIRRVLPQATLATTATTGTDAQLAAALTSATAQRSALGLLTQVSS